MITAEYLVTHCRYWDGKGTKMEVALHSLLCEYKNVQESVLTNVNIQRNASPYFQMFAFSFFGGNVICRFLPIFCPSDVPRHNLCPSKIMLFR